MRPLGEPFVIGGRRDLAAGEFPAGIETEVAGVGLDRRVGVVVQGDVHLFVPLEVEEPLPE